ILFGSDPWVKEHYDRLNSNETLSAEDTLKLLDEIQTKASQVGADLENKDRSDMKQEVAFFRAAVARSCTMVKNALALADSQTDQGPVSLIVGAAHTARVANLLKTSNVPYAVISPESLYSHSKVGNLTMHAYLRKEKQGSVDTAGQLGAFLDQRHKP